MTSDEIVARLANELPHWRLHNGTIRREFRTPDWRSAMLAAGAVGHLAEAAWHHPDLEISWGRLSVALHTHDAHAVTEKDFALAAKIEAVVAWNPASEPGPLDGVPATHPYITA